MQIAMFVNEPKIDERSSLQGAIYQTYSALLGEVNLLLQQNNYSAHELYELLIHKGYLRPTFFREFQKFLRQAIREGYVDKNRLISKTIKGVRIPNRFTKEQLLQYFNTVTDPRIAIASFIAIWSGLRIGDVIKLKVEDFDFEREIIKIVQSKRSKDRISPFLREGQQIIEKWIKYAGATEYLFPSNCSQSMATVNTPHISSKTISDGFNKVVKKANLQRIDERYNLQTTQRRKFTFHTFRHTFCTYHLENEVSAAFVARAAGHSKMDTTVGVYGHMATGNMIKSFRRSFEHDKKTKKERENKKTETNTANNPVNELAQKFITGEISEEIFIKKRKALEEAGF